MNLIWGWNNRQNIIGRCDGIPPTKSFKSRLSEVCLYIIHNVIIYGDYLDCGLSPLVFLHDTGAYRHTVF